MQSLLQHGASVDTQDHSGMTALNAAVYYSPKLKGENTNLTHPYLTQHRVSGVKSAVDILLKAGNTCHSYCAYCAWYTTVTPLLSGADCQLADHSGKSAISVAHPSVMHLLGSPEQAQKIHVSAGKYHLLSPLLVWFGVPSQYSIALSQHSTEGSVATKYCSATLQYGVKALSSFCAPCSHEEEDSTHFS